MTPTVEAILRAASVEIEAPPELLELVETMQWFTVGIWNVITAAALCCAFRQGAFYGFNGAWKPGCKRPELAYVLMTG